MKYLRCYASALMLRNATIALKSKRGLPVRISLTGAVCFECGMVEQHLGGLGPEGGVAPFAAPLVQTTENPRV